MAHELPIHHIKIQKGKTLVALVENSIKGGDNFLFRNLFATEGDKEIDILENGQNSCAAFVSWLLLTLELIKHPHATVEGTEKDLLASGWQVVNEYKLGAIVTWEPIVGELLEDQQVKHRHIGFCISNDQAISNDSMTGFPQKHHITYNDTRKIEKIYWHKELE